MSSPIVEGVFAIHKPTAMTSAHVIRDLQKHFKPSTLFQPWLENEQARLDHERRHMHKRSRKSRQPLEVKMGHGGTLDPMATGVLIIGVGSGTKVLSKFLECSKSYETVLLFGKATDTYDTTGKVVARKSFAHVTREKVEEALEHFRGQIMQRPPIFSALRVQGKRLYEYAREGKEVPVEIQERPVTVESLEMIEWMDGGSHPYRWPDVEADKEEKVVVDSVLHLEGDATPEPEPLEKNEDTLDSTGLPKDIGAKRRREEESATGETETGTSSSSSKRARTDGDASTSTDTAHPQTAENTATSSKAKSEPCPAPACKLRMTVTSGFYVRSLCHDLGIKVASLGAMAELVRTRQGDFELGKNVFEYDDLAKGEEIWSPNIEAALNTWAEKHEDTSISSSGQPPRRDHQDRSKNPQRGRQNGQKWNDKKWRNSSSPEN